MNAPSKFPLAADTPPLPAPGPAGVASGEPGNLSLLPLAAAIAEGNLTLLPASEHLLFECADWQAAADEALEGDVSELAWMLAREAAFDEFCRWQRGDYATREFSDFGEWLVCKASWNRPNRFEAALTRNERARL